MIEIRYIFLIVAVGIIFISDLINAKVNLKNFHKRIVYIIIKIVFVAVEFLGFVLGWTIFSCASRLNETSCQIQEISIMAFVVGISMMLASLFFYFYIFKSKNFKIKLVS